MYLRNLVEEKAVNLIQNFFIYFKFWTRKNIVKAIKRLYIYIIAKALLWQFSKHLFTQIGHTQMNTSQDNLKSTETWWEEISILFLYHYCCQSTLQRKTEKKGTTKDKATYLQMFKRDRCCLCFANERSFLLLTIF